MIIYDKDLANKITDTGHEQIIHFFATSYGVSIESVKMYIKIYGKYPLVYERGDRENDIMVKLIGIERFLKIKKLSNILI